TMRSQELQQQYLEPLLTLLVQIFCLLISICLIFYGFGSSHKYLWLSIYFGGSALYASSSLVSTSTLIPEVIRYLSESFVLILILNGAIGFSILSLMKHSRDQHRAIAMLCVLFFSHLLVTI